MKMLKRYFFILLVVVLILNVFSVPASASTNKSKVRAIKVTNLPANILVVKKGKSYKLKVKVATTGKISKKVTYTIADSDVATVTSTGRIKGIKNGSTKLTIRSVETPKVKKTIKVKVGTPVKKVKVTKKKVPLEIGKTYKIKTKISPKKATYKKLSYMSSNKAVAKVSKNGKVTALKPGTATITIQSKDGSNKKAKCKITVTGRSDNDENPDSPDEPVNPENPDTPDNPVEVASITLDKTAESRLISQ